MAYADIKLLINGEWVAGEGGQQDILNPADESVLGVCPHASAAQLDAAIAASAAGFETWRATTPLARQAVMEKAARILESRADEIAVNLTKEMGKPVGEAKLELGFAIDVLRWYGEEGKRAYGRMIPPRIPGARQIMVKEPVGPVAAFVAWNFPAVNVMRKVAGALGAGCSIIIKPSEETPATAVEIGRALQEAGLILDMSHAAEEAFFEALDLYDRPVIASHANPRAICDGDRQLSDDMIRRIAERGGVIGAVPFNMMLMPGWRDGGWPVIPLRRFAEAIHHTAQVAGTHAACAIGSDLDGGFGAEATPARRIEARILTIKA